jgi:hypothetical protein
MNTLKDKLANSVRQAKSVARPATVQSGGTEPTAAAPAVPPKDEAAPVPDGKRPSDDARDPAPSAKEIFPRRIWPD